MKNKQIKELKDFTLNCIDAKQKVNEILKDDQYKLICNYPNCTFMVGTTFTKVLNNTFSFEIDDIKYSAFIIDIEKYPNIFQKLD